MTYVTFSQIIHFPADDYNGNGFASGNNNKMDLSDNFEEFHLMDSLEEEELHLYEISQQSPCSQVPSHQMHAADYGPSVKMDTSSPPPLIPAGKKSAVKALKRTPERHHHQRAVTHHQTDNQFQDRSSGDGAEWSQSFDRVQTPPPTDCTAISMPAPVASAAGPCCSTSAPSPRAAPTAETIPPPHIELMARNITSTGSTTCKPQPPWPDEECVHRKR